MLLAKNKLSDTQEAKIFFCPLINVALSHSAKLCIPYVQASYRRCKSVNNFEIIAILRGATKVGVCVSVCVVVF